MNSTRTAIPNDNEVLADETPTIKVKLKMRRFFEGDTAALAAEHAPAGRADPGALLSLAERLSRMRLLLLGRQPARLRQRRGGPRRAEPRRHVDGQEAHGNVHPRRSLRIPVCSPTMIFSKSGNVS